MAGNSDSMLIRGLFISVASADGASTVIGSAFARMRGGGSPSEVGRSGADPQNGHFPASKATLRRPEVLAKDVPDPRWRGREALEHGGTGHTKPFSQISLSRSRDDYAPSPAPKPVWQGSGACAVYGTNFRTASSLESTLPATGGVRGVLGCRC